MSAEPKKRKLKNLFKKKVVRVITIAFLAILFLEFVVYFGSNLLLSNWARQKIQESSKGVYEVDFNRVNLSLLRRGIFLDGVILKSTASPQAEADQALFDLTLDQLAIKGLWYSFSKEIISIGKIQLDNPNVKLKLPEKENGKAAGDPLSLTESPVKALEVEIKKSIERLNFVGIFIHEFEISHADLFFLNFLSDNSLKADNTRLVVKEINWTTIDWKTPFNAKGFEFDLDNVSFPLPDGVHTATAVKVKVSSLNKLIDLEVVKLIPDKSVEAKAYYEVSLEDLRVGNVDLNTAFMTSAVLIDEIILTNPDFKVERRNTTTRDSTATGDLNELIDGILESIEVKELSVVSGKFLTSDYSDSLKNRIEIKDLNFNMIKFYLGKNETRKSDQFFYGQEASMDIRDASLYLSDDVHILYGDRVSLSSFKDELIMENVRIEPREEALSDLDLDNIIRLSLPKLALNNANLKLFYNEGRLEMDELLIESPKVEFTELNEKEKKPFKEGKASKLLEGYMDLVAIKRVDLRDGEVQFTDKAGVRSNDVGFERFSLLLEKVLIRPNLNSSIQDIFLANEMVLTMDKYRLKLRDDLHEFLADEILIDSKNSRVVVKNFSLKPENPEAVQTALDTYDQAVAINVMIPEFRIEGIDLQAAFWDERLIVGEILIPSPKAELTRYRKGKGNTKITDQLSSADEFETLLTSYFSFIQIDSISFSDGQVKYENFTGVRDISLSEDSLGLKLKGFLLERGKATDPDRTFFSEEIDLSLKKYSFNVAGGSYEVDTDELTYNSKSQTIFINNLRLFPSEAIKSKIEFEVKLPQVAFKGVDLQSFLFENKLILDRLAVNNSELILAINQGFEKQTQLDPKKKSSSGKALPKSIEEIKIAKIDALDSRVTINYLSEKREAQSIKTNFDLEVSGLQLDSTTSSRENFTGLFEDISLKLQDFSFALPDSIHNIKFTSLEVNNKNEETVFSDFEIVPKDKVGFPGIPLVSAKIKQLGVRHNSLSNIESTGIFDLNSVRLTDPVIDVYLDSEERPTGSAGQKSAKENAFISSVLLRDLLIQRGDITLHHKAKGQIPRMAFSNVDFGIEDLNLNLIGGELDLNPQFFLEKDLSLSLTNYRILTKDSLNKLKIGKIKFLENDLILENVFFGPEMGRYEFMRARGYQTDAIEASIQKLSLIDLDFDTFFKTKLIKARKVELDGLDVDIFRDKRMEKRDGIVKLMPQELMKNGPFDLLLDSVILTNGRVAYHEFAPRAMVPGFIEFEDLNASIAPFVIATSGTSYPLEKSVLVANAKLMGQGQVDLKSVYFFEQPYPMEMDITLGKFDLRLINSILSNGAFVAVTDGRVMDGKWDFKINEEEAWGKMNLKYEDLKIQFLDTVSMQPGRGKLNLINFLVNAITRNNNPRKFFNKRVVSDVYYKRDKSKFIISGWWKATFSGLKGSIGLGQPKVPKRKEENEE